MSFRYLEHLGADITAGNYVVSKQEQEVFSRDGVCSGVDGMTEALGFVLITEVDGESSCLCDGVGVGVFTTLAQKSLERAVRLEVAQKLGLAGGSDDDDVIYALRFKRFFNHVLNNRFVENGQHFFGRAFGCRQEARTEAGGRNDGFHDCESSLSVGCIRVPLHTSIAHCTRGTPEEGDVGN